MKKFKKFSNNDWMDMLNIMSIDELLDLHIKVSKMLKYKLEFIKKP